MKVHFVRGYLALGYLVYGYIVHGNLVRRYIVRGYFGHACKVDNRVVGAVGMLTLRQVNHMKD